MRSLPVSYPESVTRGLLLALLALTGPLMIGMTAGAPRLAPLDRAFSARRAYAYTAEVTGFGERPPGSVGHRKTEALIKRVLTRDGARIETDDFTAITPRGRLPVHNIVGKFNVTNDPFQPIFILAGHYDTLFQKGFVGANDGGSSTGILLAFADALARQHTKMQVWLLWTDLEEAVNKTFTGNDPGLYGSRHFAKKLAAEGLVPRIRGFFLLDMIGDKDLGVARETAYSTPWLQDVIARAARQLGYSKYFFQYRVGIIDDQKSFADIGIPSVDVVDARYGPMGPHFDPMGEYHHTDADTMDKVSARSLGIVGRTVLRAVALIDARE